MAKKKASAKFDDVVSNDILSSYGDILTAGNDVLNELQELEVISVSPAIDLALGGGIREGSQVQMSGPEKAGKTTTCMQLIAKCQALGKEDILYVATEGRLTKENFIGIPGLDPSGIKIMCPTHGKEVIYAEDYLNAISDYIRNKPGCIVIVDSLSNMVPQQLTDEQLRLGRRPSLPRLLSDYFKLISPIIVLRKAICVYVTHLITNTGGGPWSPSKVSDCGVMIKYAVSTNMTITHTSKWCEGTKDDGEQIGQRVHWKMTTSAAGGSPNKTAESWLRYGAGLDEVQEIAQMATELAMITKSGSWYTINAAIMNKDKPAVAKFLEANDIKTDDNDAVTKAFKFQGVQKLTDFLYANTEIKDLIYSEIRSIL